MPCLKTSDLDNPVFSTQYSRRFTSSSDNLNFIVDCFGLSVGLPVLGLISSPPTFDPT